MTVSTDYFQVTWFLIPHIFISLMMNIKPSGLHLGTKTSLAMYNSIFFLPRYVFPVFRLQIKVSVPIPSRKKKFQYPYIPIIQRRAYCLFVGS